MSKAILIFSEDYLKYDFGPQHPLRPVRLQLTYELLKAYGVFDGKSAEITPPRMATEEELQLVHSKEYISLIKKFSRSDSEVYSAYEIGLGPGDNPIFHGMYEASSLVAGGSLVAADLVMENENVTAFNIAGGLHHAMPDRASGFCIFNDPAITAAYLRKKYNARVAYLDIDAHAGDGVNWIFYDDPNVLTISFHESGRYLFPGTCFEDDIGKDLGKGFAVNIPLLPYTHKDIYLKIFDEIVPLLIKAFKPDVIINQCGVDTHYTDPLPHLLLTVQTYEALAQRIKNLSQKFANNKWIALGGGGYNPSLVARAWSTMFSIMADKKLPNEVPESWITLTKQLTDHTPLKTLYDDEDPVSKVILENKEAIEIYTDRLIQTIKEKIFPFHRI
ncbi:MAG TPA: acetoin utilization protein AcuC [Candidatus Deferrimicrobium sp.]|nr:acetoin utilization protein AcuC [Candidatus Deferrimicrobium sp.]